MSHDAEDQNKDLREFLADARNNEKATEQRLPDHFAHLFEIEELFRALSNNLHHPDTDEILVPAFIQRAYASWLGAVRLTLSGMVPEVQPLLRASLEYALYASRIRQGRDEEYDEMSLSEIWLRRDESARIKNLLIEQFKLFRLWNSIVDEEVKERAKTLYTQAIGTGGHPNPEGVLASMVTEEGDERMEVIPDILVGDSIPLRFALSSSGRVGISVLEICRTIYPERFDILSFSQRLEELKRSDYQLSVKQESEMDSLFRNRVPEEE